MITEVIAIGNMTNDIIIGPIEEFPDYGQMFFVEKVTPLLGGTCSIMASGLGKMGIKVKVIGKIGKDMYGDFLLDRLIKSGVDVSEISKVDDVQTPITLCYFNKKGEKRMIHCYGTDAEILEKDIDLSKYNSSHIFYAGGIDILLKLRGKPIARILESAKKRSITTILDTVYDPLGEGFSVIKDSLPFIDIIFVSMDEAKVYTGTDNIEGIIKFFLRKGSKVIVLKMGEKGSCIYKDGVIHEFSSPDPDNGIKDTVGAGDNFVAGFIAGIVKGFDTIDCMKLATAAAVLSITCYGGEAEYKNFNEVQEFSKKIPLANKYFLNS